MNSLDDFARLRPDEGAATADELDDIWIDLVEHEPATHRDEPDMSPPSRRRFAFVGAAAVLALGVVAIASFADRAEAPPAVSEAFVDPSIPAPTVLRLPGSQVDEAIEAGEPPLWGITEDGWMLAEFEDTTNGPVDMVRLFAGPDGLVTSWVAVVNGMSEPLLPIGSESSNVDGAGSPISTQRVATDEGSKLVIAGGVPDEQAMSLFRAVQNGGDPPDGFVETQSADAAVRTVRYRFDHAVEGSIFIEVTAGGIPNYDRQADSYETEPDIERLDVDESIALRLGDEDRAVLARNGFWVSKIAAPPAFVRHVRVLDPSEEQQIITIDRLAIGDSVMLGAAGELADLGFVVDAAESRSFVGGLDTIRSLRDQDRLPETLVVDLGNNSAVRDLDMAEFVELTADIGSVLLVTSTVEFDEIRSNNELMFTTAAANENLRMLDWEELASQCPGDCFESDGVHLKPDGREFYATLVDEAIGG